MKLVSRGIKNLCSRGGRRHRPVFETPNGTLVVKLKHGYYPVSRTGAIHSDRKYIGRVGDCEAWEAQSKCRTVTLVEIA